MPENEILNLEAESVNEDAPPAEVNEAVEATDTEGLLRELESLKERLSELERLNRARTELEAERQRIAECNETNRKMSAGSLSGVGNGGYYSPDEVRLMTPSQVRENYDDVIESMRHWN